MTEHELRMAAIELLRCSKMLLYWCDVECTGSQLKDLNEAKATIDNFHEKLRKELPYWLTDVIRILKDERDQARTELCREQEKIKLDDEKQVRENIEYLITACNKKTELLRAVRHSMDTDKPFPSLEKNNRSNQSMRDIKLQSSELFHAERPYLK